MFGLEEPYLCIKVIFVGFSLVLWLVFSFGWKFVRPEISRDSFIYLF